MSADGDVEMTSEVKKKKKKKVKSDDE